MAPTLDTITYVTIDKADNGYVLRISGKDSAKEFQNLTYVFTDRSSLFEYLVSEGL